MGDNKCIDILVQFSKSESRRLLSDFEEVILKLNLQSNDIKNNKQHVILRYLNCVFYEIKNFISNKNEIALTEQKLLEIILEYVVKLAILPNLIKGLTVISDHNLSINDDLNHVETEQKYKILSHAVDGMIDLMFGSIQMKSIIVKNHIGHLLVSLYQLCHAPIQKPNTVNKSSNFIMTDQFYAEISCNRKRHLDQLANVHSALSKVQIFQQLMMLLYRKDNNIPPLFFRRIIAQDLSNLLISEDGLKYLIISLIPDSKYDPGKHWNNINMIVKIIKTKHMQLTEEAYFQNISLQIIKILNDNVDNLDSVQAISALAAIKELSKDESLATYATSIIDKISNFIHDVSPESNEDSSIAKVLNILHFCFVQESQWKLDLQMIENSIHILYGVIYGKSINLNDTVQHKSKDLFYNYVSVLQPEKFHKLLETILEQEQSSKKIKENLLNEYENNVQLIIKSLILLFESKNNQKHIYLLFIYILKSLCNNSINPLAKKDLIESLMIISEKEYIQDMIIKDTDSLINVLLTILEGKIQCSSFSEENSELINICLMFLTTIMHNCNNDSLEKVLQLVSKLRSVNLSQEMKLLINEIHKGISRKLNHVPLDTHFSSDDSGSRYHKAINDVCDALLPVRAHGILELGKLIHENDNEAIAKKHAILCILQENLKNEDSYIYLAVIKSLTEVSKVCPEDVIELLTQEYLNNRHDKFQKDGKEELRLKVGEALVKLIFNAEKSIVQKYKTVFLNTFLSGTHDEDFLVRSSAFSNLGELCNKLGSSMGTEIISEILNKVEHCVVNEKSPEVKRSSILLCTQLLRGLQMNENESEKKLSLLVLRPALTPLLRSLRISYENNEDETLKLHAQLAIEELENMIKDFFKLL